MTLPLGLLAGAIARHLPGNWKMYNHHVDMVARLEDDKGHALLIAARYPDTNQNKISITGDAGTRTIENSDVRRRVVADMPEMTTIKVSRDRNATAIAKDIERRLLTQYFEEYQQVQDLIAQHGRTIDLQGQTLDQLVGASPASFRWSTPHSGNPFARSFGSEDAGYGKVEVTPSGTVRMQFDYLPPEVALRVMRALANPA